MAEDLNAVEGHAIGYTPHTVWRGRRQSAAHAFLHSASKRPNLRVKPDVEVLRVIVGDGRAIGVPSGAATVRRILVQTVILSAGALNSRKLLQLPGIGDPEHLRSLGIEVKAAKPGAGQNLREHCVLRPQCRLRRGSANAAYRGTGRQPAALCAAGQRSADHCGVRDNRDRSNGAWTGPARRAAGLSPVSQEFAREGFEVEREPGALCASYIIRPESRGAIQVTGADPMEPPRISPSYLAEDYDRRAIALFRVTRAFIRAGTVGRLCRMRDAARS